MWIGSAMPVAGMRIRQESMSCFCYRLTQGCSEVEGGDVPPWLFDRLVWMHGDYLKYLDGTWKMMNPAEKQSPITSGGPVTTAAAANH